jgi:adenine phosphoribosyltransferase
VAVALDQWLLRRRCARSIGTLATATIKTRHLELGFRRDLITSSDRVLAVDDIVDTAGQLLTLRALTKESGSSWVGASVLIDNLQTSHLRRELNLHAVFHVRDL